MRWVGLIIIITYAMSLAGCGYIPTRKRQEYDSEEETYEQLKQERIQEHKRNIERLEPKEPSQLY
jgi:hypothetical protein